MTTHKRRPEKNHISKMDEFPISFNEDMFHLSVIEREEKKISALRYIVYKKIKNEISDRVVNYTTIDINDKFIVSIDVDESFSLFHCAVVREEILDNGFDVAIFEPVDGRINKIDVTIERKINILDTIEDRNQKYDESSDDESS